MRPLTPLRAIVLAAAALLACSRPAPPTGTEASARIVSLTPALTETLFALELGDRVVGVTEYCDVPPEAKLRPKVGGYVNPSVEAILALTPDLVVVSPGPGNHDAVQALERAGVRIAVVPAETLDESLRAIRTVAEAAGVADRGARLVDSIALRIQAVARKVEGKPPVRVLFSVQIDPVIAAGRGTLPSQLVEAAGGVNVVEETRYPRLGIESVVALSPDVVLQSRMDVAHGDGSVERRFWERWAAIPAVAQGRVIVLSGDAALRPGPRVAQAVEELAVLLHPEAPR